MQVIGLPCHVIRNGRAAFCRTGREGRRRSARHPLSLGEAARKAKVPGELVQIDTLFINIRPGEAIRPITACDPVTNGPPHVARYLKTSGAKALLDKIVETAPFKISGIQADGGSEFKSVFEEEAKGAASNSSSCPPKARPQWLRRTRPIDLEVRILRRLRPAAHNRKTASLRRPLQHPKTARGPCRTNSRRISKIPQLRRLRKVSYVLSPDTSLRTSSTSRREWPLCDERRNLTMSGGSNSGLYT
jgi:hypothetical protein